MEFGKLSGSLGVTPGAIQVELHDMSMVEFYSQPSCFFLSLNRVLLRTGKKAEVWENCTFIPLAKALEKDCLPAVSFSLDRRYVFLEFSDGQQFKLEGECFE